LDELGIEFLSPKKQNFWLFNITKKKKLTKMTVFSINLIDVDDDTRQNMVGNTITRKHNKYKLNIFLAIKDSSGYNIAGVLFACASLYSPDDALIEFIFIFVNCKPVFPVILYRF
jgi:hypothetical protein